MKSPVEVTRGVRALRRLLAAAAFDLRDLDLVGFRRWLDHQQTRWQNDPVFVQRTRIRDLRRAHPQLEVQQEEYRRAAATDAASPQFSHLVRLEQELTDTGKAIAGLTAARERRADVQPKLDAYRARRQALHEEQAQLIGSSPRRKPCCASARSYSNSTPPSGWTARRPAWRSCCASTAGGPAPRASPSSSWHGS